MSNITNTSIPQGSVIGRLMFLIYVNNLPEALNAKRIHCLRMTLKT